MRLILQRLLRRHARQTRVGGVLCLHSDGDALFVDAFAAAGWPDPCPLTIAEAPPTDAAVIAAPEKAVEKRPVGRVV